MLNCAETEPAMLVAATTANTAAPSASRPRQPSQPSANIKRQRPLRIVISDDEDNGEPKTKRRENGRLSVGSRAVKHSSHHQAQVTVSHKFGL